MALTELVIEPRAEDAPEAPGRRRHGASVWRRLSSEGGVVFSLGAVLYCAAERSWHSTTTRSSGMRYLAWRTGSISSIHAIHTSPPSALCGIRCSRWPTRCLCSCTTSGRRWRTRDMAGTIVSSLSMAGAAFQLVATFREWGVAAPSPSRARRPLRPQPHGDLLRRQRDE